MAEVEGDEDWVSVDGKAAIEELEREEKARLESPPLPLPEGWTKVTEDGLVIRKTIVEGVGECPPPLTRVYVSMEGRIYREDETEETKAAPFFSTGKEELDFILGQAQVPKGVEIAVCTMRPGERALVRLSGKAGYGYSAARRPKEVPANALLEFDVTFIRHEKEKNLHQMSNAEKIAFAQQRREVGKSLFSQGKYGSALRQYERGLTVLQAGMAPGAVSVAEGWEDEQEEAEEAQDEQQAEGKKEDGAGQQSQAQADEGSKAKAREKASERRQKISASREELIVTFLVNSAVCHSKLGDYSQAITCASKVLERAPGHMKARFLRANAHRKRGELEEAERDYRRLLEDQLDDELKATVQRHLSLLERTRREQLAAQAKTFRKAFERTTLYADMPDAPPKRSPVAALLEPVASCFRRLCRSKPKQPPKKQSNQIKKESKKDA